jgi:hypothetical protein
MIAPGQQEKRAPPIQNELLNSSPIARRSSRELTVIEL